MKKQIFTSMLIASFLFASSQSQNTWVQKASVGTTGRSNCVTFSIGSKLYIGTGADYSGNYLKDFWEYDTVSNVWTQKADFGGTARHSALGFSINSKGYIGTGRDGNTSYKNDFWEYNPSTNSWAQKANLSTSTRMMGAGFSINGKGYAGTGITQVGGSYLNDFWEYDPTANSWTQKASLGSSGRTNMVAFASGSKGYAGTGSTLPNGGGLLNDFWEYNPSSNSWTQKANFPGSARYGAIGFSIGTKGYLGTGSNSVDFYEYNPASDIWRIRANVPGNARMYSNGISAGITGYFSSGWNVGVSYLNDLYSYKPCSNFVLGTIVKNICQGQSYYFNGVNLNASGTYYDTLYASNGCDSLITLNLTIVQPPTVTISASPPSPICSGQSTTLTASGASTYAWSTGSNLSAVTVSPTLTTTYTVTGTDIYLCSATSSKTVTVNSTPSISISPASAYTCSGQTVTLIASGGGTYSWNTGAITPSISVSPTLATTYTVTVTGTNSCTASASKTVNIYTTPSTSISADGLVTTNDTITCGDVVQLQLNGSLNATPNIQWSPNSSITNIAIANPLVYPSTTTTYSVTFTNTNGCVQTSSITIYVKPLTNIGNLSITTPSGTIALFDTLFLNVQLTNVTDLYGLYLKLKGDAAVNNYLNYAGFTTGTLLGTGGSIISTPPIVTTGVYDFGITKVGAVSGFSGTGVFYTFKFVTKNITIPNNTNFCFYLDNLSAYNSLGSQVGLVNQGPYCYTFTDKLNVWPGDLNNTKTVTTADLLPIGYFYNSTGPVRSNASIQWTAQPATLWGYGQTNPNGSAFKVFADSNGDGIISNADQTAIGFNMGKIHALTFPQDHHERAQADGDIIVNANPQSINTTQLPESMSFQISLNNNGGLNSLYGISFYLLLDNTIFDLTTANVDYTGSIFGVNGTDCLVIHYVSDSSVSVGLTRYGTAAIAGQGLLCTITLQTKASIAGSVNQTPITALIEAANNQAGDPLNVQEAVLNMSVGTNTGIPTTSANYFELRPNPANNVVYVSSNADAKNSHLTVFNYLGQKVYETDITESIQTISTVNWSMGLYSIEMKNSTGTINAVKILAVEK